MGKRCRLVSPWTMLRCGCSGFSRRQSTGLPYPPAFGFDQFLDLVVVGRLKKFQEEQPVAAVRDGRGDVAETLVHVAGLAGGRRTVTQSGCRKLCEH